MIAISVDPEDKAQEVADTVSFPVANGVTRETTNSIDSWWDDNRGFVQPSEFILNGDNKVSGGVFFIATSSSDKSQLFAVGG